ncbi:MAG: bifunctional nicotinamidase/pyrazinamidase [Treponema sp.]|nr:bifunctional nicotinamidase/pyrazinamidase [Treponema sp.]
MRNNDLNDTVLLEIDPQNDFCPAYISADGEKTPPGALAVAHGDKAIPVLNTLAKAIVAAGGRAAASQDWHPRGHSSFASSHAGKKAGDCIELPGAGAQVLWPDHCVQGTRGAAFHERLDTNPLTLIIRKGYRANLDSYSAFFENDKKTPTGLDGWLRGLDIHHLIIGGLATDYCVLYSVTDALRLGYKVTVVSDAVFGVDFPAGSTKKSIRDMKKAGALFMGSDELLQTILMTQKQIWETIS